jgi:hypothetical protein
MNTKQRHVLGTRIVGLLLCTMFLIMLPSLVRTLWTLRLHRNIPRTVFFAAWQLAMLPPGVVSLLKAPAVSRWLFLRRATEQRSLEEDLLQQVAVWSGMMLVVFSAVWTYLLFTRGMLGPMANALAGVVVGVCIMLYPPGLRKLLKGLSDVRRSEHEEGSRRSLLVTGFCAAGFFLCIRGLQGLVTAPLLVRRVPHISPLEGLAPPASLFLGGALLMFLAAPLAVWLQSETGVKEGIEETEFSPVSGLHVALVGASIYLLIISAFQARVWAFSLRSFRWIWLLGGVGCLALVVLSGRRIAARLCSTESEVDRSPARTVMYTEVAIGVIVFYMAVPAAAGQMRLWAGRIAALVMDVSVPDGTFTVATKQLDVFSGAVLLALFLFKGDLAHGSIDAAEADTDHRARCATALHPWLVLMGAVFVARSLVSPMGALASWISGTPETEVSWAGQAAPETHPLLRMTVLSAALPAHESLATARMEPGDWHDAE